ncbi:MAG TPA: AzlC family ABC transporter permease [Bacillota bacterium]
MAQRETPSSSPGWAPTAITAPRAAVLGLAASVPVVLGVFPFGVVTGALAVDVGMTPLEAVGMSILVFAGAGQVAALGLYAGGAATWVAVAGSVVVNFRFVMYSAAIAPTFQPLSPWRKVLYAYLLTDQAYLLSVDHYRRRGYPLLQGIYYLTLSAGTWLAWVVGTALGARFGGLVPAGDRLDFVIPLVFISLLMPTLRGRPAVAAALASGAVALVGYHLPLNLGLLAASLAGLAAGLAAGRGQAN